MTAGDLTSSDARDIAVRAGLTYVEDTCIGATAQLLDTHPPRDNQP